MNAEVINGKLAIVFLPYLASCYALFACDKKIIEEMILVNNFSITKQWNIVNGITCVLWCDRRDDYFEILKATRRLKSDNQQPFVSIL